MNWVILSCKVTHIKKKKALLNDNYELMEVIWENCKPKLKFSPTINKKTIKNRKVTESTFFLVIYLKRSRRSINFELKAKKTLKNRAEKSYKTSMATTTQKPHPSQIAAIDPRLRRAVYAKYREMLISKHDQANDMIKQLPAYMVHVDHGFGGNVLNNK